MERIARMFGVRRNNDLGFTLIELLVVIAIIGLLSGIAIPIFLGQRTKAVKSEATTNLSVLFVQAEQYYAEQGQYPPCGNTTKDVSNYLGTYSTVEGTPGIEDIHPSFRPGSINDLKFDYRIVSYADCATWQGVAIGKTGTAFAGKKFFLNDKNEFGIASFY